MRTGEALHDGPVTGHGQGHGAIVQTQHRMACGPVEVLFSQDDIRRPTSWRIRDPHHAIVVHMGGEMHELETELEAHAGSHGPALPGEIWSIPAGRAYASRARGKIIRYGVISLTNDTCAKLLDRSPGSIDLQAVAGVRDDFLVHSLRQLQSLSIDATDIGQLTCSAIGHAIGMHLLRSYNVDHTEVSKRREDERRFSAETIRRLRDYIQAHLAEPIRLADLAVLAQCSVHHLLIGFRHGFGITPAQYLIHERLRAAQRQLRESRRDLTDIALSCGFSSHSHFTSTFTKRIGCSPSQYRQHPGP
jgi:AraC family transcriptional regulator